MLVGELRAGCFLNVANCNDSEQSTVLVAGEEMRLVSPMSDANDGDTEWCLTCGVHD